MGCLDTRQDAVNLPVNGGSEQARHIGIKDPGAKPVRGAYCVPDALRWIRRHCQLRRRPADGKAVGG